MRTATVWIAVVCLCAGVGAARADDYEWIAGSGNWSELTNWQLGDASTPTGLPGATDNVTFSRPDTGDVNITVDVDPTLANLTIGGGARWHFNGAGATVAVSGTVDCGDMGYMSGFQPVLTGTASLDFHGTLPPPSNAYRNYYYMYFTNPSNSYTGTTTVRSGIIAMASIGIGTVRVEGGDLLQTASWDKDLTLAGGRYGMPSGYPFDVGGIINAGDITLDGDSTLLTGSNFDRDWRLTGVISGDYKLTYDAQGVGQNLSGSKLTLSNTNNSFSGGVDIVCGKLYAEAYEALGTGTVHVSAGMAYAGGLAVMVDPVAADPATIVADPGGWVALVQDASEMTFPLILNGGTLTTGIYWNENRSPTHNSADPVALTADSFVGNGEGGGTLTVKSQIVETDGSSFSLTKNLGAGQVVLDNPDNDYSGGTTVLLGTLRSNQTGSLGTGTVVAGQASGPLIYWGYPIYRYGSSRLATGGDGSLDGVASVMVYGESVLQINSTELGGVDSPMITVAAGGALRVGGGSTDLIYSGTTQNVQLDRGAILYNVADAPTYDEVTALAGGSGFGVYLAADGTHSTDYTNDGGNGFGDGGAGSTNIYRGLASADGQTLTFTGTAEEVTGGTAGVDLYAQAGSTFRLGDTNTPCTITGSKLTLSGYGTFEHRTSLNALPDTIEMNGNWELVIVDPFSITSSQTVEVNSGLVAFQDPWALEAGATVNVNAGGMFRADLYVSSGTVNIKDGGAEFIADEANFSPYLVREPGARICLSDTDLAATPPSGPGLVYLIRDHTTFNGGLLMDEGSRLMFWANYLGDPKKTDGVDVRGTIALASGAASATLAVPAENKFLRIRGPLNFAEGTLIVGDTDPLVVPKEDGNRGYGSAALSQDGVVYLYNDSGFSSDIGAIDVRAGVLQADRVYDFGGAKDIRIRQDAQLRIWDQTGMATVVHGEGTVDARGSRRLTLQPAEGIPAGIGADLGARGMLDVTGHLGFVAYSGTTPANPSVNVSVVGAAAVPGVDFGQVNVTGNVTGTSAVEVVVSLPVPSVHLKPNLLTDMDVMTGGSVSAGPVAAVRIGERIPGRAEIDWSDGDFNFDGTVGIADLVALADHYGERDGDIDWKVDDAVVGAEGTGNSLVLHGEALLWAPLMGDANLDGIVGIADLVALAENYGAREPGSTVPEPAALAILLAGGILLRRRRR